MCNAGPNDEQLRKAWDNAREIIRNENDLINHRTVTSLTLQGFLFAGSVALINGSSDFKWLFIMLASIVGFLSAYRATLFIEAANRHIAATNVWWDNFFTNRECNPPTANSNPPTANNNKKFRDELPFPIMIGMVEGSLSWLMRFIRIKKENEKIKEHYIKLWNSLLIADASKDAIKEQILNPYRTILFIFLMIIWGFTLPFAGYYFYYKNLLPSLGTMNVTKIIVIEDQNNKKVTISFEGGLDKIPDLEKRIKAIP